MISFPIIYKGSDEVIQITLKDEDSNAINPNDCAEIIVSVYQTKGTIIQSFKLSLGKVVVADADAGEVRVLLSYKATENLPEKRLFMQIEIDLHNAEFDQTQRMKIAHIDLADLKDSV